MTALKAVILRRQQIADLFPPLQLHAECHPGAGDHAGPEPWAAPSLHHASHGRHAQTGECWPWGRPVCASKQLLLVWSSVGMAMQFCVEKS